MDSANLPYGRAEAKGDHPHEGSGVEAAKNRQCTCFSSAEKNQCNTW